MDQFDLTNFSDIVLKESICSDWHFTGVIMSAYKDELDKRKMETLRLLKFIMAKNGQLISIKDRLPSSIEVQSEAIDDILFTSIKVMRGKHVHFRHFITAAGIQYLRANNAPIHPEIMKAINRAKVKDLESVYVRDAEGTITVTSIEALEALPDWVVDTLKIDGVVVVPLPTRTDVYSTS